MFSNKINLFWTSTLFLYQGKKLFNIGPLEGALGSVLSPLVKHIEGMQKLSIRFEEVDIYNFLKICLLRCVYICEFHARFRIKLARFVTRASLVRNRPRNCANVNAPLIKFVQFQYFTKKMAAANFIQKLSGEIEQVVCPILSILR
jgi:hypothetical protein